MSDRRPMRNKLWIEKRLRWTLLGLLAAACWLEGGIARGQGTVPAGAPQAEAPPKLNIAQELGLAPLPGFGGEEQHVELFASFTLEKGSRKGALTVSAQIQEGWHVYSVTQKPGGPMASKIKVPESKAFKLTGPFQADRPPHVQKLDIYTVPVEEHEGRVTWSAPLELSAGTKPEDLKIELTYTGQVCAEVCIPLSEKLTASFAGYTAPPQARGEYRPAPNQAQLVITGHVEPAVVAPGGQAQLVITATPTPEWHVYAYAPTDPDIVGANKPTLIVLNAPPGWTRSPVKASRQPLVKAALQPGLPKEKYHSEPVTWTIDLAAPVESPKGEVVLSGYLGLQTCKEGCLPPHAVQFRAAIPVAASAETGQIPLDFIAVQRSEEGEPAAAVQSYRDVARLAAENPAPTGEIDFAALVPIVGFGLLGGLILNLMPCVLPVVGLKILSFVQQGGESRARIFALNFWFVAGLLSVFVVLATLAAFANLSWGQQFTYTSFKVAMVVLVFAMALAFLGVWEVPIPGFAQSQSSSMLQQRPGLRGAFFKGIFTTLLATPCSGPFLGPVFAYTLAQPPLVTYVIFLSVGLGMASPYLAIGAFPALVRWLPKPGEWMETFKEVMGFVLLATVVYLFATISADYFIPTLALVVGVWFACWLIGRVPLYAETGPQLRAWGLGIAAAAAVGWGAFTYLGPTKELLEWQPYSAEALAKLQAEGKTVMVDFTADWCLTCQYNMKYAINTRRVEEVVNKHGVVPLVADWTDQNDTIKQKLAELNSNSIPLLAIYPANKPGEVIVLRDALLEKQVVAALEQAGPSQPAPTSTVSAGLPAAPREGGGGEG